MRFNPKARIDQGQIQNRGRGGGGGGGFGGGPAGMRIPLPTGGGGGRIGIGTVVLLVVFFLVSQCAGVGPQLSGDSGNGQQGTQAVDDQCRTGEDANRSEDCAIDLLTNSIQNYWGKAYPQQTGRAYTPTQTVKFQGSTSSGCGQAGSAMGPFYCPNDRFVYLDSTFFDQMLRGELGAQGGPFAIGYVLAHEYGHYLEDQLGILGRMRTQKGPRSDAVRVELMADCLAGIWAGNAQKTTDAAGTAIISDLTQDDIKRAIDAAQAVGDDRIQRRSSGRVNPEQWTHGSAEQRMRWFNTGMKSGSIKACNTFETDRL